MLRRLGANRIEHSTVTLPHAFEARGSGVYISAGAYYSLSASWKIGAAIAYGQSKSYYQGKPFFAPVPGVAFLYRRIALNMVVLPSNEATAKIAGVAFFLTIPLEKGR